MSHRPRPLVHSDDAWPLVEWEHDLVLHVNAFVPADKVDAVCDSLTSAAGVSHVVAGARTTTGLVGVSAEISVEHAEPIVDLMTAPVTIGRVNNDRAGSARPARSTSAMMIAIAPVPWAAMNAVLVNSVAPAMPNRYP